MIQIDGLATAVNETEGKTAAFKTRIPEKTPLLAVLDKVEMKEGQNKGKGESVGFSVRLVVNLNPDAVESGWSDTDKFEATFAYLFLGYKNGDKYNIARDKEGNYASWVYPTLALVRNCHPLDNTGAIDPDANVGTAMVITFRHETDDDGNLRARPTVLEQYKQGETVSPVLSVAGMENTPVTADTGLDAYL